MAWKRFYCGAIKLVFILLPVFACRSKGSLSDLENAEHPPMPTDVQQEDNLSGEREKWHFERWFNYPDSVNPGYRVHSIINPAGNPVLRSHDCNLLKEAAYGLAAVLKTKDKLALLEYSRPKAKDWCEVNLHPITTDRFRQLYSRTGADTTDVNCWASALYFGGIKKEWSITGDDSWSFFQSSLACRLLDPSEKAKPGDFLSMRMPGDGMRPLEVHGAVYISDDIWLSKNGASSLLLRESPAVIGNYGQTRDQWRCVDPRSDQRGCAIILQYFRCQSNSVFEANTDVFSGAIKAIYAEIEPILNDYERLLFSGYPGDYALFESYPVNEPFNWTMVDGYHSEEDQKKIHAFLDSSSSTYYRVEKHAYKIPEFSANFLKELRNQSPEHNCLKQKANSTEIYSCFRKDNESIDEFSSFQVAYIQRYASKLYEHIRELWRAHKESTAARKVIEAKLYLALNLHFRMQSFNGNHVNFINADMKLPDDLDPFTVFSPSPRVNHILVDGPSLDYGSCRRCRLFLSDVKPEGFKKIIQELSDWVVDGSIGPSDFRAQGGSHYSLKFSSNQKLTATQVRERMKKIGVHLKLLTEWD
ncbi:MAG: hypothetical protein R3B45_12925 [Bdellovibrionota bacterium]